MRNRPERSSLGSASQPCVTNFTCCSPALHTIAPIGSTVPSPSTHSPPFASSTHSTLRTAVDVRTSTPRLRSPDA